MSHEPPEPGPDQPGSPYPQGWGSTPPPSPPPSRNPYGEPSPYGDPSGQPAPTPTGAYPPPAAPTPAFGFGGYAGWWARVGAYLIDELVITVAGAPAWVGYSVLAANTTTTANADGTSSVHYSGSVALPIALLVLGTLTSLACYIWNICIRQGRTGASVGKSVLAIRLVNADLQPIGAGWCFLRSVLHIVDALPCYLGYLWPIWDSRKQTFADKIVSSYVVHATTPAPQPR